MVGMNNAGAANMYNAYAAQTEQSKVKDADKASNTKEVKKSQVSNYGKTVGEPKLSETAQKYYDQLKKKFGNYDFILVSKDQMANVKANPAKYANSAKTVVLIDEEKIEKMATDENFRKKYEGILSGAASQIEQLKSQIEQSGGKVKGFGIQINENGTASYFAVLKKSSAEQKARIEKKAEQKKIDRKNAEKKAAKKELEERRTHKKDSDDDEISISANSLEELMQKISDFTFEDRSNSVQTESEKLVGQNFDFRG